MGDNLPERIYGENVTYRQNDSNNEGNQQNGKRVQLCESPRNELALFINKGTPSVHFASSLAERPIITLKMESPKI